MEVGESGDGATVVKPVRALFVTYGGGHVDIVLRLLPHLDRLSAVDVRVLALTTAGPRMVQEGYQALGCRDYLPLAGYEQALELGAELSPELWDESSGISWEESCAYLGVSMLDLIAELGEEEAQRRYQAEGRKAFCPTRFMAEVLQHEQPQLVITTCHVRMERAAVLAARDLGITTVRIEDLFGYSLLGNYGVERAPVLLPEVEWPGQVIVLNEEVKRRLMTAGFPEARIHPLGQPVFSEWQEQFEQIAPCPTLQDWIAKGQPVITYATPARRDVLYSQTEVMLAVAHRHPEWGICIKLHPSVGPGEFEARYPELPINVRLLADVDILPVVRASDMVVIFRSTVGLLCLFTDIPLLVLDTTGEPETIPYVSSGVASGIDNLDDLDDTLKHRLVHMYQVPERRNELLLENPVGAANRIANWLVTEATVQSNG